jgi:hypothetical protein
MLLWIVWKRRWKHILAGNRHIRMKKLLIYLVLTVCCYNSLSQDFILDKRSKIKSKMEKFYADNNRKYIFTETDSTISYILNDSLSLPATTVFYFNGQNRCIQQDNIFSCDSCLQQSRQGFLKNKFANWTQAPGVENYYAGFPYNTLMRQINAKGQFILRLSYVKRKELKNTFVE